jgi:hypothetical protein
VFDFGLPAYPFFRGCSTTTGKSFAISTLTPCSTSCHVKATEPCAYFYV